MKILHLEDSFGFISGQTIMPTFGFVNTNAVELSISSVFSNPEENSKVIDSGFDA